MKKSLLFFAALLLVSGGAVMSQTLDEVLAGHFSATGQDNLLKINSQKITGKMIQSGIEIPFVQYAKRPGKVRLEASLQGMTLIQTFNGTEGWMINPFAGVTAPQPMTEDQLRSVKYQADSDGMLWNWKEKGYQVTLEGQEDMEGTSCYKIKLATEPGDIFTFWIDADTYILLRQNTKMTVMGNESESDNYFSNYSMVEGIAMPGKAETKMQGQLVMTLIFEKVEFNQELEDTLFDKPSV
ncbi:MAG: outer membrane lipoprotein-sorting protein [Bacteroidales bacterium]|nr:outer membrane lipoprotein-sorting protein [Bacteroidales bacterium]